MRIYNSIQEEVVRDKLVGIECDWCKAEYKNEDTFDGKDSTFEVNEFKLKWRDGSQYPEGGSGEEIEVELCHKCREKLKVLLTNNDITLHEREWDW